MSDPSGNDPQLARLLAEAAGIRPREEDFVNLELLLRALLADLNRLDELGLDTVQPQMHTEHPPATND